MLIYSALMDFQVSGKQLVQCIGIQRGIIHQIRATTKYVSYKHIKEFVADLKEVYDTLNEEMALEKLNEFKEKWEKLPICSVVGRKLGYSY